MKNLDKASIVLIIVSILFFLINFYEAYRLTSILDLDVIEILFTYETFVIEVYIILSILYLIILIKYNDSYDKMHYIIKRTYLIVHLMIANIGFLLGLNLEYLLGNKDAYYYQPMIHIWLYIPFLLLIVLLDIFLLSTRQNVKKKPRWIDFLQVLLTIFFALLFQMLITDSVTLMGVFD